jgi:hypothetical protein
MIEYILGILTGLVIAVLNLFLFKKNEARINQTVAKLNPKHQTGKVIGLEDEELNEWVNNLKEK